MTKFRNVLFAVTAAASLGVVSLITTTTSADARFGGGGYQGGGNRMSAAQPARTGSFRPNYAFRGNHATNQNWPKGNGCGYGCNKPNNGPVWNKPHWPGNAQAGNHYPRPHHRPHWWRPSYTPSYVSAPTYVAPTYVAPAPAYVAPASYQAAPAYTAPAPVAASNCTCLRKEYTQDGQVVMRDVCTNEVLAGPVGGQQAQAYPQQQGYPQQQ